MIHNMIYAISLKAKETMFLTTWFALKCSNVSKFISMLNILTQTSKNISQMKQNPLKMSSLTSENSRVKETVTPAEPSSVKRKIIDDNMSELLKVTVNETSSKSI